MRWRLLTAFVAAFTVVFLVIAFWVVHFASEAATNRLTGQLLEAAAGASQALPTKDVVEVVALPADSDPSLNPSYRMLQEDLTAVQGIIPPAEPFIYTADAEEVYFLVGDQPFRAPASSTLPPSTLEFMREGLTTTTLQSVNDDDSGSWISAYSPILDGGGEVVAAVGIDYSLAYVDEVRQRARARVFPVLAVSYLSLIVLVLVVSTLVVRPLQRLTSATRLIADGDYDLDLHQLGADSRFADEMTDLAESFSVMASKVAAREQALATQVRRLQVEIDASKREQAVREITETDFFAGLAGKADQLRSIMRPE
ncbi:MAG: HAMP domain-containing protein [Candidatus Nanopelagicales bacterium]|nr:HAMP domain-containing protein [Candidatus Nanopelagicales bacterium]